MDMLWEFMNGLFNPEPPYLNYLVKTTRDLRSDYKLYYDICGAWNRVEYLLDDAVIMNYNGESYHVDRDTKGDLLDSLTQYEDAGDTSTFRITASYKDHPVNNVLIEIIPLTPN